MIKNIQKAIKFQQNSIELKIKNNPVKMKSNKAQFCFPNKAKWP